MLKKFLIIVMSSCIFGLNAFAQPGFQAQLPQAFTVSGSISAQQAVCGPNDEVHHLYITQAGTVVVISKKVGATSWTSKGLNQIAGSTASTARNIPVLNMTPSGHGCITWQSSTKTLISTKSPLEAAWSNAVQLGTVENDLLSIDSGAACATNENGEVLAVWRNKQNLVESFRNTNGDWTHKNIKTNLNGAADHINRFELFFNNTSAKLFHHIYNSTTGDTVSSMARNSIGDWVEESPFLPRRLDGYYLVDSDFDTALNKGVMSVYLDNLSTTSSDAGYSFSVFGLNDTPQLTSLGPVNATNRTGGSYVGARNLSGNFIHVIPYFREDSQKIESKVRHLNTDFVLSSIAKEADPKVSVYVGEVAAALSGVNSVLALSSTLRTKQKEDSIVGLESSVSQLIATIIKNGQKTDTILREDSGNESVFGYTPAIAACTSGSGTLSYVKSDGKIVTLDYINDSSTDPTNPGAPTPGTQTPTAPGGSGSDSCPDDISKTDAGVCGCGKTEADINADTLIDCGSPRAFVKNIVPTIVSATPDGKGKLIVQVEGLAGTKLKYTLSVKGKGYSKDFNASKLRVNLKKLPAGAVTLKLKITQKVGKKTIKSKASAAFKATVS